MVTGLTALLSHSRKKGLFSSPTCRMPKASGWMDLKLPPRRKYLEALWGGSSCTISMGREAACLCMAAANQCTDAVCSRFLSSCLVLLPTTLRQMRGSRWSSSAALHLFLAAPTEDLSRCAMKLIPLPVRASRRMPSTCASCHKAELPEPRQHPEQSCPPDSQQFPQVRGENPRPVRHQVQGPLLGGFQHAWKHPACDLSSYPFSMWACG